MMKNLVVIYYGEMGSGKSYTAQQTALSTGADFYEGDNAVTPEMRRCILFRPIPRDVLEDFLFNHFVPEVLRRAEETPYLVVAQALYSREHRRRIKEILEAAGHEVWMIHVDVPVLQNIRQLLTRKRGIRWVLYWAMNHFFFQRN